MRNSHYDDWIARALATEGGHLSIGRGGFLLCFGEGSRLSGYDSDAVKAACIAAGLPVIDSRDVPFDAVIALAVHGPMVAVGRPVSPQPWHALSFVPLEAVARAYARAGAEVVNLPGRGRRTGSRREGPQPAAEDGAMTAPEMPGNADRALWRAQAEAYQRLAVEACAINKGSLLEALTRADISMVTVEFDGCGDSGQIEAMQVQAGEEQVSLPECDIETATPLWDGSALERSRTGTPLRDVIETLTYDVLTVAHAGWENNEGAFGTVVFDIAERTIRVACNERQVIADYHEHEF